ncbi:hypothetical protein P7C70_g6926, partial [Phenoliferia sp. Uapishka_3]
MAEAELDIQAAAFAAQLLHIGNLLGQVESSAAVLEQIDPSFWSRIKASVEAQALHSQLSDASPSNEAIHRAVRRWIFPELNARCPTPAVTIDSVEMIQDGPDFGPPHQVAQHSPSPYHNSSILPAPPPAASQGSPAPTPSFSVDTSMYPSSSTILASSAYPSLNIDTNVYPVTYFPPISVPPTSAPLFDPAPYSAPYTSINPQLLFKSPPTTDASLPALPSIFTSFASPFPNGDIMVATAFDVWEAVSPKTAMGSHSQQSMFDRFTYGGSLGAPGGGFSSMNGTEAPFTHNAPAYDPS